MQDLGTSIGKRLRAEFLADRDIWGDFDSKKDLKEFFERQLEENDAVREALLKAVTKAIRQDYLTAIDLDDLWKRVLKAHE